MSRSILALIVGLLFACASILPSHAQDPEVPPPPVQEMIAAIEQWNEALRGGEEDAVASAREAVEAAVDTIVEEPSEPGLDDYRYCATLLYKAQFYEECIRLCTSGISVVEQPYWLNDYLGMSHLVLGQRGDTNVEMRSHIQAAVDAFTTARGLPVATEPAHIYLYYALSAIGEFDRALKDYDSVVESGLYTGRFAKAPCYTRGRMLLGAGRFAEASETLGSEETRREDPEIDTSPLLVRALAMSGETELAITHARRGWGAERSEETLAVLTDALAFGGEVDEALELVEATPLMADHDDEADVHDTKKSRAVLEYLIRLDGERPDDFRARLTELLDHHFVVMDSPESEVDLSSSPICMGHLLRQVSFCRSMWANDLLAVVCIEEVEDYEPDDFETGMIEVIIDEETRAVLEGEEALRNALQVLRVHRVLPDTTPVLALERLIE